MLSIITSTGDELLRNVDIDDLEPQKYGVLVNFSRFRAATCNSRVNCTEIARDRPRQSVYEIFSIECGF